METDSNYQALEYKWSGLKQQVTNLARYSELIVNEKVVWGIDIFFTIYSGIATGWLTAKLFTVGKEGAMEVVGNIIGYSFGLLLAFLMGLSIQYNQLGAIKLSGEDYREKDDKLEEYILIGFGILASLTTIIASAMFTYAQVKIVETAQFSMENDRQQKIEQQQETIAYNDSVFQAQVIYYRSLDFDNDRTNDEDSRATLKMIEGKRDVDRKNELVILDSLRNLPDKPGYNTIQDNAADATVLLRDVSGKKKPENYWYFITMALVATLIGFCVEWGIRLPSKMLGRKRAFENVTKVLKAVNEVKQEFFDIYGSKPYPSSKTVKRSSNGSIDRNPPGNETGEGIDLDSDKIKKIISDIEERWTYNGGDLTFEQIGEMNDGVTKQYISQVFNKAVAKGKTIDPRD